MSIGDRLEMSFQVVSRILPFHIVYAPIANAGSCKRLNEYQKLHSS